MKWKLVALGDCVENVATCNPAVLFKDKPFNYVDIASVDNVSKRIVENSRVNGVDAPSRARQLIYADDVLVSTVRPNLNAVAMVPRGLEQAIGSTGYCVLRVKKDLLDNRYLFYWVRSERFIKDMVKKATGASYPAVSDTIIKSSFIPLPPLHIQRQIADTLDKADVLRRKDQELLQKYDELAQSIFYDMFGDPVRNEKKFKRTTLGDLVANKSDLVDGPFGSSVNVKTDYTEDGEIPVVRTKNVGLLSFKEDDLKFMTREKYEMVKRSQVLPGDIIITKVGTIGNVCLFPEHLKEGVLSTTGSCRFRPMPDRINSKYLVYHLLYQRKLLNEMASEGVQPFLNMSHIKSIPIMLPPIEEQNVFDERIDIVERMKLQVYATISNSGMTFNKLLNDYFS